MTDKGWKRVEGSSEGFGREETVLAGFVGVGGKDASERGNHGGNGN
jgi:hypothetical protein